MSGLSNRRSRRQVSSVHHIKQASQRWRKPRRVLLATPLVFVGLTGSIGQQDIYGLLSQKEAETPRWMMALTSASFTTAIAPTTPGLPGRAADVPDAPQLALTSAIKDVEATNVDGLSAVARDVLPTVIPDEIAVNRAAKADRFITRAPDRQMVDMSAGAVYAMRSLYATDKKTEDLPRVAFVIPEPLTEQQSTLLAGIPTRVPGTAGPLDLQQVMMARNAAAASFSLVSAYAPDSVQDTKEPFDALFGAAKYEQELPPPEDPNNPHWWAQKPLPLSVGQAKEQRCLAEGIYFEARGESEEGQVAVAQVVLNRVKNPAYPDSICGVVYQNRHKRNRCQFSFACDGIKDRISSPDAWNTAQRLAREVLDGKQYSKMVDASTHYHATYVNPRWAKSMAKRGQVGLHIFYKTYAGGWN